MSSVDRALLLMHPISSMLFCILLESGTFVHLAIVDSIIRAACQDTIDETSKFCQLSDTRIFVARVCTADCSGGASRFVATAGTSLPNPNPAPVNSVDQLTLTTIVLYGV